MDQPCSALSGYFANYRTDPPSDYHQPQQKTSGYPNYFELETFYDSVAYGNLPTGYPKPEYPFTWEVQTPYTYPNPQVDNDSRDQNNNHGFYELSSYQNLGQVLQTDHCNSVAAGGSFMLPSTQNTDNDGLPIQQFFPQSDLCTQVVHEPSSYSVSESQEPSEIPLIDLCSLVDQEPVPFSVEDSFLVSIASDEVSPELVENILQMDESRLLDEIKLASAEKSPTISSPIAKIATHLPLKNRQLTVSLPNPDGKYACISCDRTFNRQGHLTQHFNAHHSGPLDQRCPVCGKRFRLREELEKHQLRHKEQNKSWVCGYCPKRFNYKFDMIRHVKAVHTEAPHSCQICGKRFVRLDHLRQHERKHGKPKKSYGTNGPAAKRKRED